MSDSVFDLSDSQISSRFLPLSNIYAHRYSLHDSNAMDPGRNAAQTFKELIKIQWPTIVSPYKYAFGSCISPLTAYQVNSLFTINSAKILGHGVWSMPRKLVAVYDIPYYYNSHAKRTEGHIRMAETLRRGRKERRSG